MNRWKDVAELLGLELDEEFRFANRGGNSVCKFKFTSDGLLYESGDRWLNCDKTHILQMLISGTYEVVKLPWKPKTGEAYYTVENFNGFRVSVSIWAEEVIDCALLKQGLVFATKEEAIEKGIPIAKELIKNYESIVRPIQESSE